MVLLLTCMRWASPTINLLLSFLLCVCVNVSCLWSGFGAFMWIFHKCWMISDCVLLTWTQIKWSKKDWSNTASDSSGSLFIFYLFFDWVLCATVNYHLPSGSCNYKQTFLIEFNRNWNCAVVWNPSARFHCGSHDGHVSCPRLDASKVSLLITVE